MIIDEELLNLIAVNYLKEEQVIPFCEWLPQELNRLFPKQKKFLVA